MRDAISDVLLWVSKCAGLWVRCPQLASLYKTTTVHFELKISCPDDTTMKYTQTSSAACYSFMQNNIWFVVTELVESRAY
jgi:hypothetical protein